MSSSCTVGLCTKYINSFAKKLIRNDSPHSCLVHMTFSHKEPSRLRACTPEKALRSVLPRFDRPLFCLITCSPPLLSNLIKSRDLGTGLAAVINFTFTFFSQAGNQWFLKPCSPISQWYTLIPEEIQQEDGNFKVNAGRPEMRVEMGSGH